MHGFSVTLVTLATGAGIPPVITPVHDLTESSRDIAYGDPQVAVQRRARQPATRMDWLRRAVPASGRGPGGLASAGSRGRTGPAGSRGLASAGSRGRTGPA